VSRRARAGRPAYGAIPAARCDHLLREAAWGSSGVRREILASNQIGGEGMAVTGQFGEQAADTEESFFPGRVGQVELDRRGCGTRRSGADRAAVERSLDWGNAVRRCSGSYGRQNDNDDGAGRRPERECRSAVPISPIVRWEWLMGEGQPKPVRGVARGRAHTRARHPAAQAAHTTWWCECERDH